MTDAIEQAINVLELAGEVIDPYDDLWHMMHDAAEGLKAIRPHKPLFAEMIAQHPGLREELRAMDDPKKELRTLYELTGNILDINTVLINRNELRSMIR